MDAVSTIELALQIGVPLALIAFGLTVGRLLENRHLRQLTEREAAAADVLVTDLRGFPGGDGTTPSTIVTGEAVMGADYLRVMLGQLVKIVGGRMGGYELLARRARREACLRMIESARAAGYDAVCNVRLDTADLVASTQRQQGLVSIAVLATGTAYRRRR